MIEELQLSTFSNCTTSTATILPDGGGIKERRNDEVGMMDENQEGVIMKEVPRKRAMEEEWKKRILGGGIMKDA